MRGPPPAASKAPGIPPGSREYYDQPPHMAQRKDSPIRTTPSPSIDGPSDHTLSIARRRGNTPQFAQSIWGRPDCPSADETDIDIATIDPVTSNIPETWSIVCSIGTDHGGQSVY